MATLNKYQYKILIDRTVGVTLCYILSIVARSLGAILKRNHEIDADNVKNIVVAKYLGLGSILQSSPLMRSLRETYPNAKITYVTSYRNEDMLKRISLIDNYILIKDDKFLDLAFTSLSTIFKLWKLKVDFYFDLEVYSSYASMMTTLSAAKNRYGFFRKSTNFRKGLHTSLVFFNTNQHIMYNYIQLGSLVNAHAHDFELYLPKVFPADRLNGDELINQGGNEFIVVNVNASDLLLERRWPSEYYAALLDKLSADFHYNIFMIGSKGERNYVQSIIDKTTSKSSKIINIAGNTNLGTLIYMLGKAKLVVTNDSGPFHLSVANKVPTLSLWGPVSIIHYGPLNKELNRTLYVNIFCSPCLHHTETPPCGGDNQCLKLISVDTVYSELKYFFTNNTWIKTPIDQKLYLTSKEGKVYGNAQL